MKLKVLTLFPEMIENALSTSILGRAVKAEKIEYQCINIRDYANNKHNSVDDYPYGGGAGMLIQAQPVYDAWKAAAGIHTPRTIYLTPQGATFNQRMAEDFAKEDELIFICGHYEGIDERVLEEVVTDFVSIGDYVLTGGELPTLVMIDAISRLVDGVLHNDESAETETFDNGLLEYPQYTRPPVWRERKVPDVLLSGDHKKIEEWRLKMSMERTLANRPDLYMNYLVENAPEGRKRRNKNKRYTLTTKKSPKI